MLICVIGGGIVLRNLEKSSCGLQSCLSWPFSVFVHRVCSMSHSFARIDLEVLAGLVVLLGFIYHQGQLLQI